MALRRRSMFFFGLSSFGFLSAFGPMKPRFAWKKQLLWLFPYSPVLVSHISIESRNSGLIRFSLQMWHFLLFLKICQSRFVMMSGFGVFNVCRILLSNRNNLSLNSSAAFFVSIVALSVFLDLAALTVVSDKGHSKTTCSVFICFFCASYSFTLFFGNFFDQSF